MAFFLQQFTAWLLSRRVALLCVRRFALWIRPLRGVGDTTFDRCTRVGTPAFLHYLPLLRLQRLNGEHLKYQDELIGTQIDILLAASNSGTTQEMYASNPSPTKQLVSSFCYVFS